MFWGVVFIFFATLFQDQTNPVVELGLAIASFTYGGLLGIFLLGLLNSSTREVDAVISFVVTIAFMTWIIFAVWHEPGTGWTVAFMPTDEVVAERGLRAIGWPWYTAIGAAVNLAIGSLLGLRHR